MRAIGLTAALIVLSGLAGAAEARAGELGRSEWLATPRLERQGPGGKFSGQIFERLVHAGNISFSIGNIVYLRSPKTAAFDVADFAEKTGKAMGFKRWNERRNNGAYVFENLWQAAGRYVRLYVKDEGDSIAYSIAMFRYAYADSMALETELIQRKLAGVDEQRLPWLKGLMSFIDRTVGFPQAYAQASPCATCVPGDLICATAAAACAQNQLVNQMTQMNTNLGNFNTQFGNFNTQFGSFNTQLAGMNANMTTANANWAASNAEMKRTNDLLKSFIDPAHAFLWAGASAAGAAVGALAVSGAVELISAAGSAIYEAITHEKEEARIMERFAKARELWEKTSTLAGDLEKAIDNLLYLKDISTKFGMSREDLIKRLGVESAKKEAEYDRTKRLLDRATEQNDTVCVEELAKQKSELRDFVEEVNKLRSRLQDPLSDAAICTNLKKDLSQLLMAEGTLQKARAAILGGQDVWQRKWNEENEQARAELGRAREKVRRRNHDAVEIANETQKKALAEQDAIWFREMDKCKRDEAGFIGDIPLIGIIRDAWGSKCFNKLEKAFVGERYKRRVREINKAHEDALREAGREYNDAAQRADDMYLHSPTMMADLKGYDMWFDQVRSEQACLQNKNACNESAKKGVMTRFEVLAAKGQKIDEVCANVGKPVAPLAAKAVAKPVPAPQAKVEPKVEPTVVAAVPAIDSGEKDKKVEAVPTELTWQPAP
ncbi:MAG: hypothetical protein HY075_14760 [Deltaproteobacteria bacterium]|nr:hypothetical protein [Deltaproteobacteria bacterium]